jgi:hypothetical protein
VEHFASSAQLPHATFVRAAPQLSVAFASVPQTIFAFVQIVWSLSATHPSTPTGGGAGGGGGVPGPESDPGGGGVSAL